jgi:hypothetical protein
MGELTNEIRELLEKTARTRYEFLRAELQTCSIALEMAKYELSVGNVAVARKEVGAVEAGIATMRRFLPQISVDQRIEFETKLADLQAALEPLRAQLDS